MRGCSCGNDDCECYFGCDCEVRGDTMSDEPKPHLPFDNDDPMFVLGVEVGILDHRLSTEPLPISMLVHAGNAEMMLRLGEAFNVPVRCEDTTDEWIEVVFG